MPHVISRPSSVLSNFKIFGTFLLFSGIWSRKIFNQRACVFLEHGTYLLEDRHT